MLVYQTPPSPVDCRYVAVPACEPDIVNARSTNEALACFQMRARDTIDFSVDFGPWLQANGNAQLSAATFVVATDSPATPVIEGQVFAATGRCAVVLTAQEGVKGGDAYYLDITATIAATQVAQPGDVPIPQRKLVRRIHVVVVNA